MNGIIYKYTNLLNSKVYVGQTTEPHTRLVTHSRAAKNRSPYPLHRAIRKYGQSNFLYSVIDHATDKQTLNALEKHYIGLYESHIPSKGYNLTLGGGGTHGYRHTKETKKKLSEHNHSEKTKELLRKYRIGSRHLDVTKEKIRAALIGRPISPEILANRIGKKRTPHFIENQRIAVTNYWKNKKNRAFGPQSKVICPRCLKIGGMGNMKRYHFSNCKNTVKS